MPTWPRRAKNRPALFDSGDADGFLFYVMPYVEGQTLQERVDREKQ
jgi:serine/threonine-protein kinase